MTDTPFANYQNEIYLRGMFAGERPRLPLDWRELERRAAQVAQPAAWGYVAGGAGTEATVRENRAALDRRRIVPRMLRDVSERRLARTVLGTELPAPLLLAPIGVQTLMHPDGELAVARAAASVGVPLVASTAASHTLEQIAQAAGELPLWYQLYWPQDRSVATSFIERAQTAGYRAVVVTLDTWLLGWRPRDLGEGFLPFLRGEGNVNYLRDPAFRALLERPPEDDMQAAVAQWAWQFSNPGVTWDDLAWLRETTSLPIVLKGIQHRDDARLAVAHGVRRDPRLKPRWPSGQRRDRLARRAPRRRRGGWGALHRAVRQRHPRRLGRTQGARARRPRRHARAPLHVGTRARRRSRRARAAARVPRRSRPRARTKRTR